MKKTVLLLVLPFLLLGLTPPTKEKISAQEWDLLVGTVLNENWRKAYHLSENYLQRYKRTPNERQAAAIRFMQIYAVGGMVADLHLPREKALAMIKKHIGKTATLPGQKMHVEVGQTLNNCWQRADNRPDLWISRRVNSSQTKVLCYTSMSTNAAYQAEFEDKMVFIGGTIHDLKTANLPERTCIAIELTSIYLHTVASF